MLTLLQLSGLEGNSYLSVNMQNGVSVETADPKPFGKDGTQTVGKTTSAHVGNVQPPILSAQTMPKPCQPRFIPPRDAPLFMVPGLPDARTAVSNSGSWLWAPHSTAPSPAHASATSAFPHALARPIPSFVPPPASIPAQCHRSEPTHVSPTTPEPEDYNSTGNMTHAWR